MEIVKTIEGSNINVSDCIGGVLCALNWAYEI